MQSSYDLFLSCNYLIADYEILRKTFTTRTGATVNKSCTTSIFIGPMTWRFYSKVQSDGISALLYLTYVSYKCRVLPSLRSGSPKNKNIFSESLISGYVLPVSIHFENLIWYRFKHTQNHQIDVYFFAYHYVNDTKRISSTQQKF